MLTLPYHVILRVHPAAERASSVVSEEWMLGKVLAVHVFVPQYAYALGAGENGCCRHPFVRYRMPECRSWGAPFVTPYLVSDDSISVDHLLYTLQEWSR